MSEDLGSRIRANQEKLRAELKSCYDFIVCGSGSSGSVVARRLAETPDVNVLLVEAGGNDDTPNVMKASLWRTNLASERDWNFQAQPNAHLNGRSIPMNMGKVLGGGSSINAMSWVRGHKTDWDFFASETDDMAWNYESVKRIYRRMKIGAVRRIPSTAERGDPFLSRPLTSSRSAQPCAKARARWGS